MTKVSAHELKTWPVYFNAVQSGAKRFEVRRDDRPFETGDTVRLREWDAANGYSGRELNFRIGYVLRGRLPEHVVFSLESLASQPAPSDWQQRIAAMSPWRQGVADDYCHFCGASKLAVLERGHKPDCLWQNAVDALPHEPEDGKLRAHDWTHDWVSDSIGTCWCRHCGRNPGSAQHPCPRRRPDAKDAIPPQPSDWRQRAEASLRELVKAMRDYEMDVEESAPYRHREMMARAQSVLKDAIPPVSEGATAQMVTGLALGSHMCMCGHCSHAHFKNHPLAAIRDGCSACNCTEFVPVSEADASPVKEER